LTFVFNNKNKWDRYIGDLSYPIYIGHMLIITVVSSIVGNFQIHNREVFSLICVFLSVLSAVFLNKYIGIPIENIKNSFRTKTL